MLHAREDYNGRVVDLAEPRIRNAFGDLCEGINKLMTDPELADKLPREVLDRLGMDTLALGEALYGGAWITGQSWEEWEATGRKAIPDDEPVFLLRAQDLTAYAAVHYWAVQNEAREGADRALVQSARLHSTRMLEWPTQKLADGPPV